MEWFGHQPGITRTSKARMGEHFRTQEDSPKCCIHKIPDPPLCFKKEQVFIKHQLRQRDPKACGSNLQRK